MADKNAHSNYSLADIEKYLHGKLSAAEMHELERAALQDPFLADAIEGFSEADPAVSHLHLDEIEKKLLADKEEAKVVPMVARPNQWMRIAASVILLAGIGGTAILLLNRNQKQESLAVNKNEPAQKKDEAILTAPIKDSAKIVSPATLAKIESKHAVIKNADTYAAAEPPAAKENSALANVPAVKSMSDTIMLNATAMKATSRESVDNKGSFGAMRKNDADTAKVVVGYGTAKDLAAYNSAAPPPPNTKSLATQGQKVTELLKQLPTLNISSEGKVLSQPLSNVMPVTNIAQGKITNKLGEPISYASIQLTNNKAIELMADANGNFSLPIADTSSVPVVISSTGYTTQQIVLNSGINNKVVLKENEPSLSETVMVTLGSKKEKRSSLNDDIKMDTLMPLGGWQNFQNYVFRKLSTGSESAVSLHGDVELEFNLDETGRPKDIAVLKSPDTHINEQIVDAVKKGPKWTVTDKKAKGKKKVTIKF